MKFDKSHIVSGSIGAILGAFFIWEIGTISGNHAALFSSNEKETTIYEKVNEDLDGDVYITPKGKKYHEGVIFFESRKNSNRLHVLLSSKWDIRHAENVNHR